MITYKSITTQDNEKLTQLIDESVYFVNASSDEKFALWQKYNNVIKWEDINPGYYLFVGHIKNIKELPVYIDLFFSEIENKVVCFYSANSNYSDNTMIEEFIKIYRDSSKNKDNRNNSTNFSNFELVLHYLKKNWWKMTEFDTEEYTTLVKKRK